MARFKSHEEYCRQVAEELATGQRDERLWLESYVLTRGDEARAREHYIRTLADRLYWLAHGPGSETNQALPRMGLAPRVPKSNVASARHGVDDASAPAGMLSIQQSSDREAVTGIQTPSLPEDVKQTPSEAIPKGGIGVRVPHWAVVVSISVLTLIVIAVALLKPARTVVLPAVDVTEMQTRVTRQEVLADAGYTASAAQQAALAERLIGKWECVPQQSTTQGEKFRYFYEYLPGGRLRFLGEESRWLVAPNLHILEDASGPASRADGMVDYRLEWEGNDRYVRTEANFHSSSLCSRVAAG